MEVTSEQKEKYLEVIKRSIELDQASTELVDYIDKQLADFLDMALNQLSIRIGMPDNFPDVLSYIVINVVIRYFNLKGKEGATSFSQEGESTSIISNMLNGYEQDIDRFLNPSAPNKPAATFY